MNQVIVASAARTPLGAFGGKLASLSEQQLGAAAMLEAVRRAGIAPSLIDEVIAGIAKQTSNPSNGARHALLLARLPEDIPAYTVQRQSASGLQAIANGYWAIQCGDAGVVLAGGMESTSRIPFEIYNARYDFTEKRREIVDALVAQETGAQPPESYGLLTRAQVAGNIVRKYALSAGDLAAFTEESFQKTHLAGESGLDREEVFPLTLKQGKKEELISRDELPQRGLLLSPPADGAAMCLLASRKKAETLGLPVLGGILATGIAAGDPRYAGMAVLSATSQALRRANMTLREMDVIELHEMSAAECLVVLREWESGGLDREALAERVNPSGGALARGNPWGAAGAVLLTKALYELRRRGGRFGLVAAGAEGGQGMALVLGNQA